MIIPIPQNNWGFQHNFFVNNSCFLSCLRTSPAPTFLGKMFRHGNNLKELNSQVMDRILSPQQSCVEPLIPSTSYCDFIWML